MAESAPHDPSYPRPQLRRPGWRALDGAWDFELDRAARLRDPDAPDFAATIRVPFAPETPASGIAERDFFDACWYRRTFDAPALSGRRLILHFGAVDYAATVWVNGHRVAEHEGGYTPFSADITDALAPSGAQTIVVRAHDDPHDLAKPRGKQDWQREPHAIWYPRTTGIWQAVWLEDVPSSRIDALRWTPDLDRWQIALEATVVGAHEGMRLRVRLSLAGRTLADDTYALDGPTVRRSIALHDPGIDDARNALLWWPWKPTLIDARLELLGAGGDVIDAVDSYTALRSVAVDDDRFLLNGRPYDLRLVLDQGYWAETGLTPPDADALRRDIELAKAMGFNGVRKHQKVEDPRYLAWADRLGLLVWEEMPSAYRFDRTAIGRMTREWSHVVARDASHPCIVAWVPFNESWGVPDLPRSAGQRHYVEGIYHLTKALDPTRPVVGNDGWESVATDIIGVHDYDQDPQRLAARYAAEALPELIARGRPARRRITLCEHPPAPVVLTEFGGVALAKDPKTTWGYSRASSAKELGDRYRALLDAVRSLSHLAGFCYTQFADTYQETNGLLYMDRTPKLPLDQIRAATAGR
jgi:beta-galactosidase/beta-glucuronidase